MTEQDVRPRPPTPVGPAALDQYRRWARFLFALLASVAGIGLLLLAVSANVDAERAAASLPLVILLGVNVAVTVIVLLGLARGVSAGVAWAVHAVAPVCYVLIAFGLLRSLLAIGRSEFLIPLEAMGALLVLTRPHEAASMPMTTDADRRRVNIVTVLLALTYFVPLLVPAVTG